MKLSWLARALGVQMQWARKGAARKWYGLVLHGLAGVTIMYVGFFDRSAPESFGHLRAVEGVAAALVVGLAWEIIGWRAWGWPGSGLDLYPWPLGAVAMAMSLLYALQF